ncbi:MAG: hypothetical protein ACREXU_17010, partial [Gammaproteobacteria bacterium]
MIANQATVHPNRFSSKFRTSPQFWPQSGTAQNWDAVGKVSSNGGSEWLLVEAKAHVGEIVTHCQAKAESSLKTIRDAFEKTKRALGVPNDARHDWLKDYY